MKVTKSIHAFIMLAVAFLWGCAPTEEERKEQEEIEKNKPSLSIQPMGPLTEPETGSTLLQANVLMSKTIEEDVTVKYNIQPDTATGLDVAVRTGVLSIPAGSNSATFDVTIYADDIDEADEEFTIKLTDPSDNAKLGTSAQLVTIKDATNDTMKISFYSGETVRVSETFGDYKIKLKLSNPSTEDTSIPFTLSGLATQGSDYQLKTESPIVVPAGESEAELIVNFFDAESIPEGGESLVIQLEVDNDADQNPNFELEEPSSFTFTIAGNVGLNDTGVTTWYDGSDFTSSIPDSANPGQDADFGRDTESNADSDGLDGFSFTNLDIAGNIVNNPSNAYCVQDNRTGLVFELKKSAETLPSKSGDALKDELQTQIDNDNYLYDSANRNWQATNFKYYWFNSDGTANGGSTGAQGSDFVNTDYPISNSCAFPHKSMTSYDPKNTACNTEVYANALNSYSICGFKDWKLPTVEQLRSIYNYREKSLPTNGSPDFFPNTDEGNYISSTPSADGNGAIWCVSGKTGQVLFCNKNHPNHVRMVREGAQ